MDDPREGSSKKTPKDSEEKQNGKEQEEADKDKDLIIIIDQDSGVSTLERRYAESLSPRQFRDALGTHIMKKLTFEDAVKKTIKETSSPKPGPSSSSQSVSPKPSPSSSGQNISPKRSAPSSSQSSPPKRGPSSSAQSSSDHSGPSFNVRSSSEPMLTNREENSTPTEAPLSYKLFEHIPNANEDAIERGFERRESLQSPIPEEVDLDLDDNHSTPPKHPRRSVSR